MSSNENNANAWMVVFDHEDREYYYNTETGETCWDRPLEFKDEEEKEQVDEEVQEQVAGQVEVERENQVESATVAAETTQEVVQEPNADAEGVIASINTTLSSSNPNGVASINTTTTPTTTCLETRKTVHEMEMLKLQQVHELAMQKMRLDHEFRMATVAAAAETNDE